MTTTMQTTAETILAQLGGNRFIAMTGSSQFFSLESGLQFKLARNESGANKCRIVLVGDMYTVTFYAIRGIACRVVSETEMVYASDLRDMFTRTTGMDTSL